MSFWSAEVESTIDPLTLKPGEEAVHSLAVNNYDLSDREMKPVCTCTGEHLSYGNSKVWTPKSVHCKGGEQVDPAATKRLKIEGTVKPNELPSVEQVRVEVTMKCLEPPFREEHLAQVHTLTLNPT